MLPKSWWQLEQLYSVNSGEAALPCAAEVARCFNGQRAFRRFELSDRPACREKVIGFFFRPMFGQSLQVRRILKNKPWMTGSNQIMVNLAPGDPT